MIEPELNKILQAEAAAAEKAAADATKIQAVVRGRQARSEFLRKKAENARLQEEKEKAATTIQRFARGREGRQQEEQAAARRLASIYKMIKWINEVIDHSEALTYIQMLVKTLERYVYEYKKSLDPTIGEKIQAIKQRIEEKAEKTRLQILYIQTLTSLLNSQSDPAKPAKPKILIRNATLLRNQLKNKSNAVLEKVKEKANAVAEQAEEQAEEQAAEAEAEAAARKRCKGKVAAGTSIFIGAGGIAAAFVPTTAVSGGVTAAALVGHSLAYAGLCAAGVVAGTALTAAMIASGVGAALLLVGVVLAVCCCKNSKPQERNLRKVECSVSSAQA